jgi:hypothetical protein
MEPDAHAAAHAGLCGLRSLQRREHTRQADIETDPMHMPSGTPLVVVALSSASEPWVSPPVLIGTSCIIEISLLAAVGDMSDGSP